MTLVAAIRPDSINFPLLLHVAGAMLLVGTLLVAALALVAGWRSTDTSGTTLLTRFGLKTLLVGVVPSYILMRIGAQWTESREKFPDSYDPAWLGIGYVTSDVGGLLILISIILAVLGLRRLREPAAQPVVARIVAAVTVLLLAAYAVAVWAMTTKPS